MNQAEKISLSCFHSALCPSERYHPHPPHMIPKLSVMFKKKKGKNTLPNHHTASNPLHGHMFLCSLELNLLHNFSFRQMFLSGSTGKINSPGAVGCRRVARLSRVPGAHGHSKPLGAPSQSSLQHRLSAGRHLLGTSAYCPPSKLRGSLVG